MSKAKYKSVTHIEVLGFDDAEDGEIPFEVESSFEPDEPILSMQLATVLHGSRRRVDHLLGDGLWAHGAVGV